MLFFKSETFISRLPYLRILIITLHGTGSSIIHYSIISAVVRSKSFLVETKAEDDAANIQDSVKNRRLDPSKPGLGLCYYCRGSACNKYGCGRRG